METIISRLRKCQGTNEIPHITLDGGQTLIRKIVNIIPENDQIMLGERDFKITIKISEIAKVSSSE